MMNPQVHALAILILNTNFCNCSTFLHKPHGCMQQEAEF